MQYILSSKEIKAWDEFTILHEPISSIALMERAAFACSKWIMNKWDSKSPIVIFCGNGNNGGDGLVIARHLLEFGYKITVYTDLENNKRSIDNQKNMDELKNLFSQSLCSINDNYEIAQDSIIIDALFGTGLNKCIDGKEKIWIEKINSFSNKKISIDVPSGLMIDEYDENNYCIQADYTLTFQCYKYTFLFPETGKYCGKIIRIDIGLLNEYLKIIDSKKYIIDSKLSSSIYKARKSFSHKGTYGHSLLICGSHGKMGACILASKACLRSGTGLLSILIPETENDILQISTPEAMSITYKENSSLPSIENYTSIGIGSGLGTSEKSIAIIQALFPQTSIPLILDADALNIISLQLELLEELPKGSLLTPHPKEFDRLFGESKNSFERHMKQLSESKKHGIYILLKGKHTCISSPEGESYFNLTGNAGMAKGGSGDVLTGIITALFAQYKNMLQAAILGVYLHGLAGDLTLNDQSQESMLASDLIEHLGNAFASFDTSL